MFANGTQEKIDFMKSFKISEITLNVGQAVYLEGEVSDKLYTILEGWAFRYKSMPDGRRQIVNYAYQGDFLGLQNSMTEKSPHGVEALTLLRLCVFQKSRLPTLFERQPSLALDLVWLAAREERFLDEGLLSVGRRTAREKVSYLLWYLHTRAVEAGLTFDNTLFLPMNQQHFADTLGISLVYVNRTLQSLRASKCLTLTGRTLVIHDKAKLAELAGIDPKRPERRPII